MDIQSGLSGRSEIRWRWRPTSANRKHDLEGRRPIVLPYVKGTMERVARVMKRHRVPVTMRLVKILRMLLVHPKDQQEKEEIMDSVYKIPCGYCEKTYIGETGRKFGTRFKEHKREGEATTNKPFTRIQRLSSLSEQNKSALTDHASHDNHVINWPVSTILDMTGAPGGSRRQFSSERRDGIQWTGMRAATHWATHTTDFLPRHITTVARTRRRTEQASSDGLW